jgi:hypothetical protein
MNRRRLVTRRIYLRPQRKAARARDFSRALGHRYV